MIGQKSKKPKYEDMSETVRMVEEHKPYYQHMMLAKKDFVIHHNDYHREIKIGEDVSDVPTMFHQNLKTEGVI